MDTSISRAVEQLANGSMLKLRDAQGHGVAVISGCLWVTQDGDLRDIIVEAGDSARFDRAGLVILQALADTRLLLLEPVAPLAPSRWPVAMALHREARRLRSVAFGDLLMRLAALLRRPWTQA